MTIFDEFPEEARQTLMGLSATIQEQWWERYGFKFQTGWIAAALFHEHGEIAKAIQYGRQVTISHRHYEDPETMAGLTQEELSMIPSLSDELFDKCWTNYMAFLSMQEMEREDDDE